MLNRSAQTSQPSHTPQQLLVSDEVGVCALRNEIRQLARALGLGLTQQARITAAASAVSRALIQHSLTVSFMVQPASHGAQLGLEVTCVPPGVYGRQGEHEVEQMLNMSEVRLLVDDVRLSVIAGRPLLMLRMWVA